MDAEIDEYKQQEHSRHEFITKHLQLLVKDSCAKLQIESDPKIAEHLYKELLEGYSLRDLEHAIKIIKTFAIKLISYFVVYTKLVGKLIDLGGNYSQVDIQKNLEKIMASIRVVHFKSLETYYLHHPNKTEVLQTMSPLVSYVACKALHIVFQLYLLSRPDPVVTLQDVLITDCP